VTPQSDTARRRREVGADWRRPHNIGCLGFERSLRCRGNIDFGDTLRLVGTWQHTGLDNVAAEARREIFAGTSAANIGWSDQNERGRHQRRRSDADGQ